MPDFKDRLAERRALFAELYEAGKLPGFKRCHETHYQYTLCGDLLDFWPGRGTFRWRSQTYHDIRLIPFIKQQETQDEENHTD